MSNALPQIRLADTDRTTTQLGFGGSGLMGSLSEQESLRLLETAYDVGIRHFDVAPSYGHGAAERCLGKFLRGKQDQVTVTTKYGIEPPSNPGILDLARSILRPVVRLTAKRLPFLRQRVASAAAGFKGRSNFSVAQAASSLDRSRRELGLDRIDLWLLHEVTAADLGNRALLDFLHDQVRLGRIGAFGIGGDVAHHPALWQHHRAFCRVLQFDWPGFPDDSVAHPDPHPYPGSFLIHHRVVQQSLARLSLLMARDPQVWPRLSQALQFEHFPSGPSTSSQMAALLLNAALFAYPDRMVIFSSRSSNHIRANADEASGPKGSLRAYIFQRQLYPAEF